MSPYGLQDKVQALRMVPKSSTINPAHLSRLISYCVLSLSHTHTTYALVILNSWPVLSNRLSLFRCQGSYSCSCFCLQPPHSTQAHTRTPTRSSTSWTPICLSRSTPGSPFSSTGRTDHFFLHVPMICYIDTVPLTVLLISLYMSYFMPDAELLEGRNCVLLVIICQHQAWC